MLTFVPVAFGQSLYWDANGTTAGAGGTPAGTWGASQFWNTSSTGGAGTFSTTTTASDNLFFVAGPSSTSGNSAYAVTVSGPQAANSITIQSSGNASIGVVGGDSVTIGAGGITVPQFAFGTTNNGSQAIRAPIILATSQTWTINRGLTVGLSSTGLVELGASNLIADTGSNGNLVLNGTMTGSGSLTKNGLGSLTLPGTNTASGGITLNAGKLVVNGVGSGTLTINGGTLETTGNRTNTVPVVVNNDWAYSTTSNSALTLNGSIDLAGATRTISIGFSGGNSFLELGGIVSNGGFALTGTGVFRLAGANTYSGTTANNQTTLRLRNQRALQNSTLLQSGTGAVVFDTITTATFGGLSASDPSLSLTLTNTSNAAVALTVGNNNETTAYAGSLTGLGSLAKTGAGTLTLSGSNSYAGSTTVSAGTLLVGNASALGSGIANLTAAGGTLDLGGFGVTRSGTVSFTGGTVQSGTITNDTVAFAAQSGAVSAVLAGAAGLTKTTSGTVTLSGANTYSGATTLSAGTLLLGNASAIGSSTLTPGSNAMLSASVPLTGANSVANNITTGATPFIVGGTNALELSGTITQSGNSTVQFSNPGGTTLSGAIWLSNTTTARSLIFSGTADVVVTGAIGNNPVDNATGASNLTYNGSGVLTLAGTNSFTGSLNVNGGGTLSVSSFANQLGGVSFNGLRIGTQSGAGTLRYSGSGETASRVVHVGGASNEAVGTTSTVEQEGTGLLQLHGVAMFTTTNSIASTLVLQGSTSGTGEFTAGVTTNTGNTLNVTKRGTGTWILSSATSTYNGQLTIEQGTLQSGTVNDVSSNGPLGNSALAVLMGGSNGTLGTFAYSGSASRSTTKPFTLVTGGSGGFNVLTATTALTLSGTIDGGGSLVKLGSGTLALAAQNAYTGATVVNAGVLVLGVSNALSASSALTVAGGGLALGANSNSVASLTLTSGSITGSGSIASAAGFDLRSGSILAGLGGAGGLTKSTAGLVTLSGSNGYSGQTAITAGILEVAAGGSINSTSGIDVAAGAQFAFNGTTPLVVAPVLAGADSSNRAILGGSGTINAPLTLNSVGDVLSPGNSPGILGFGTSQTWASFAYDWETNDFTGLAAGTAFDQIAITGGLSLTGGVGAYEVNLLSLTAGNMPGNVPNFDDSSRSWVILTTTGGITGFNSSNWTIETSGFMTTTAPTGSWSVRQSGNDIVLDYVIVPEPTSGAIAIVGIAGLAWWLRRQPRATFDAQQRPAPRFEP